MKKIGLTGGIGSGKSTVASIFSQLGVPVFNSDFIARELQDNDTALKKIFKQFLALKFIIMESWIVFNLLELYLLIRIN